MYAIKILLTYSWVKLSKPGLQSPRHCCPHAQPVLLNTWCDGACMQARCLPPSAWQILKTELCNFCYILRIIISD